VRISVIAWSLQVRSTFTFTHPSDSSTAREWIVHTWLAPVSMQVSSLSGHFLARLYDDITMSTLFDSYTPGLIGWLPTVFPFRNVVFVERNEVNQHQEDIVSSRPGNHRSSAAMHERHTCLV